MASLNNKWDVNYDTQKFEEWSALFPSLGMLLDNRVEATVKKYPHKAEDIAICFVGDITGITPADVENRTACVTAISIMDGKPTFKGMITEFFRKLSRKERVSLPSLKKMQPIIVCTVVMVAPAGAPKAKDAG